LLLYSRHDFVQGDWRASLKKGVADQARRFEAWPSTVRARGLGGVEPSTSASPIRSSRCAGCGNRPHLRRREAPPPLIDELIRLTYRAIIDGYANDQGATREEAAMTGATNVTPHASSPSKVLDRNSNPCR